MNTGKKLMEENDFSGCFTWDAEAKIIAETLSIVKPKNILETGFFKGASAFMWLYLSNAKLTSVDPMENLYNPSEPHTGDIKKVDILKNMFPDRFNFLKKDSRLIRDDIKDEKFDLFFIDGDHLESGIRNDFQIAIDMNIEWILVDDFVTSVVDIYNKEFLTQFFPVRMFPREAQFEGQPIPVVLMKRYDQDILAKLAS